MDDKFLDAFPYPWSLKQAQAFHQWLSENFPLADKATDLAEAVGIYLWEINLGQPAAFIWHDILDLAAGRLATRKLFVAASAVAEKPFEFTEKSQ